MLRYWPSWGLGVWSHGLTASNKNTKKNKNKNINNKNISNNDNATSTTIATMLLTDLNRLQISPFLPVSSGPIDQSKTTPVTFTTTTTTTINEDANHGNNGLYDKYVLHKNDDDDFELVIRSAKELGWILDTYFQAQGRGLREKLSSVPGLREDKVLKLQIRYVTRQVASANMFLLNIYCLSFLPIINIIMIVTISMLIYASTYNRIVKHI
jgi:hypothetical protein